MSGTAPLSRSFLKLAELTQELPLFPELCPPLRLRPTPLFTLRALEEPAALGGEQHATRDHPPVEPTNEALGRLVLTLFHFHYLRHEFTILSEHSIPQIIPHVNRLYWST